MSERYEHGSIILTSNKYFSDWGELLSDTVIATVLLDRLLHHAHVINIRGQTYWLKDRLKAGVQPVPPADIPALTISFKPDFIFSSLRNLAEILLYL